MSLGNSRIVLSSAALLLGGTLGCGNDSPANVDARDQDIVDAARGSDGAMPDANTEACEGIGLPASATTPYEDLLCHRGGFGGAVTGGAGGELIVIDNLNDGSFLTALEQQGPKWIRFSVSGTIQYTGEIEITSNTTIDGRGADIVISSDSDADPEFHFYGADKENLIVHNITFKNIGSPSTASGVGLAINNGAHNVWVDHCTFTRNHDDAITVGHAGTDITVSHVRYEDQYLGGVYGWSPDHTEDVAMKVTFHHNSFDGSNVTTPYPNKMIRTPAIRYGQFHVYNNYINAWGSGGTVSYNEGELRVENNVYDTPGGNLEPPIKTTDGYICQLGNLLKSSSVFLTGVEDAITEEIVDGEGSPWYDCTQVFDAPYEYALSVANDALATRIQAMAGRMDQPMW